MDDGHENETDDIIEEIDLHRKLKITSLMKTDNSLDAKADNDNSEDGGLRNG